MNRAYISVLTLLAIMLMWGCNKNQQGDPNKTQPVGRIMMAEGSLSVNNLSDVHIFPIVKTTREEYFGVVSAGDFKMVGFARIEADKSARVIWEEGFNAPKRTAVFPLKITEEVAKQTRHLEFLYKGNGVWLLNLYNTSPPDDGAPLASIGGNVQEQVE